LIDWNNITPYINFAGQYPKGIPLTTRSINYHQALNNVAERIQIANKVRFKTITEIFRIALHIGMQVIYHTFVFAPGLAKDTRGYFFYMELEKAHRLLERARMSESLYSYSLELLEMVRKGTLSEDDCKKQFKTLYDAIPDVDKPHVMYTFNSKDENDAGRRSKTLSFFSDLINDSNQTNPGSGTGSSTP
jgi:hypothetical protein